MSQTRPLPHPDPYVDATRGYIDHLCRCLQERGVEIDRAWLDPSAPRDATLVLGDQALVWDESQGWTRGGFVSGRPGVRTVLSDRESLGGGVLVSPGHLAKLLVTGPAAAQTRDFDAGHDGFEDALAWYNETT